MEATNLESAGQLTMQLQAWKEHPSDREQLRVLETPLDEALFVVGPPGSGKTILAAKRADALAKHYGLAPVVTYNRLSRRTLEALGKANDLNVVASTMHSYVSWHELGRTKWNAPRDPLNRFAFQWHKMLARPGVPRDDNSALVVDEGQDLPSGFFDYAAKFVARNMSVFADQDQTISDHGSTLEQIQRAANLPDPIFLRVNHRNSPEIAVLADHFLRGRLAAAPVMRPGFGGRPQLVGSRNENSTADLIADDFLNRSGNVGIIVSRNSTGKSIQRLLMKRLPNSRVDRYASGIMNEGLIDILAPGITVLNRQSAKGQEFDAVFILELERFIPCNDDAEYRAMYMMCSRARDRLTLVYGPEPLSQPAVAALPNDNILERTPRSDDR